MAAGFTAAMPWLLSGGERRRGASEREGVGRLGFVREVEGDKGKRGELRGAAVDKREGGGQGARARARGMLDSATRGKQCEVEGDAGWAGLT